MKQHTAPVVIELESNGTVGKTSVLNREPSGPGNCNFNEADLQALIHAHPQILPIGEIEPVFAGAIALCRELPTDSGKCDNLYINEGGYLTIVECKLWRNPEARRKVVAQVVDYAKDIAAWDYEELQRRVHQARGDASQSLFELATGGAPDVDEQDFVDSVQRNMSLARFLLLIVGDGIHERAENLTEFLQRFGGLGFTLAMVELPLYRLDDGRIVATPRVLMRTTEIVRTIVQVDDRRTVVAAPDLSPTGKPRITTSSERVFYERLAAAAGAEVASEVEGFVGRLADRLGIVASLGRGNTISLSLKSADERFNFGLIQEDGTVWYFGIVNRTEDIGARAIGEEYLEALARIVGAEVDRSTTQTYWSVRRRGKHLPIAEYLRHGQAWIELIERTLERIAEHEEGE